MATNISFSLLLTIAPQLVLSFGIVMLMLLTAWRRSQRLVQRSTQLILLIALLVNSQLFLVDNTVVTTLLKVDGHSTYAFMLLILSALMVVSLSRDFLTQAIEVHDEYYLLVLLVTLGASILVVSDHFASLFLGFELLSLALVGLVGYAREQQYSVETGFKYLILSACASSFMLLGIAFIYAQTGALNFSHIEQAITSSPALTMVQGRFLIVGILLFLMGIAFKLSLVPFHFWTPDVYQGSPTPITMLMATVSKVAMFVVLIKCWFVITSFSSSASIGSSASHVAGSEKLTLLVSTIAILSMLVGNVLALQQTNMKRLLGYSSIAHMGYLLIVLQVSTTKSIDFAWQSTLFYLTAYVLANLSVFMVILTIENSTAQIKKVTDFQVSISDFTGLFWQSRPLALLLLIGVLSLAGVPLSMGFIAKFYLLSHAVTMQLWWLISALIIGSGISLFYYLRIIFVLFTMEKVSMVKVSTINILTDEKSSTNSINVQYSTQLLVILLSLLGLAFGLFPDSISLLLASL